MCLTDFTLAYEQVKAAYQRGDLFTKRRKMAQDWTDYLGKLKA